MTPTPVRVLLVDDHPVIRDGLQQVLGADRRVRVVVGHARATERRRSRSRRRWSRTSSSWTC